MALDPRIASRITRYRRTLSQQLQRASETVAVPRPAWQLRNRVGGRFEEIGKQQFDFMLDQGLLPHHRMIDLGCGVLRGGLHYINYLDAGLYYGIDLSDEMIAGAYAECEAAGLNGKAPSLRTTDTFDIDFGAKFDYGIALSVFTHVPWNSWFRALTSVSETFAPGGRFYASFFPGPEGPERFDPIVQAIVAPATNPVTTFGDRNHYHYAPSDFARVADIVGLELTVIGEWGHLRGQHMLQFTKPA